MRFTQFIEKQKAVKETSRESLIANYRRLAMLAASEKASEVQLRQLAETAQSLGLSHAGIEADLAMIRDVAELERRLGSDPDKAMQTLNVECMSYGAKITAAQAALQRVKEQATAARYKLQELSRLHQRLADLRTGRVFDGAAWYTGAGLETVIGGKGAVITREFDADRYATLRM